MAARPSFYGPPGKAWFAARGPGRRINPDPARETVYGVTVAFCPAPGHSERIERFAALDRSEAVSKAWGRIVRAIRAGEAVAFTTRHEEWKVNEPTDGAF